MKAKDLASDLMIKDWFLTVSAKDWTQEKYLYSMQFFTELVKKTPKELIEEAEEEIIDGVLMRKRQIRRYLLEYKQYLIDKKYAPMTITLNMTAVRSFYKAFDIDLPHNLLKDADNQPLKRNMNHNFDKELIRKMLFYANIRDRAIILTMKSSGMARQETRNVMYQQFREGYDKETKVATLFMRREKVGLDFVTFIDPEGTEAIIEYLKKTKRMDNDGNFLSQYDSTPLFIMTRTGEKLDKSHITIIFWELSKKMKIHSISKDQGTRKYNPIRSHNLRKFFRTTLLHDGMDDTFINKLMGHKIGNTSQAYLLEDAKRLKEQYLTHMNSLAIYSVSTNADLQKDIQRLKMKLKRADMKDETPEQAFMAMLEDEEFVRQLFEKLKAFK